MKAPEVLEAVQSAGGTLTLKDQRIQYVVPESAVWLVSEIKEHREELVAMLRAQETPLPMPPGVRLLKWAPRTPPIAIVRTGIVTNAHTFIAATLSQLEARLEGKDFLAGNWSLRELLDRLDQVGVQVQVETTLCSGFSSK
jgi:hypothetical protein